MALLEQNGMQGLNERLCQARTKVFDMIAEHNFAAMMIRYFGQSARISYEPAGYGPRPPDFQVEVPLHMFWLQMKRFSPTRAENIRNQIIQRIERETVAIAVPKFYAIEFAETFSMDDVLGFIDFVRPMSRGSQDGTDYDYVDGAGHLKARVQFWAPRTIVLDHLMLGASADIQAINVTGVAAEQIRTSIRNASGAFIRNIDGDNINLVVAESDRYREIDVSEACFGTEYEWIRAGGEGGWSRKGDGVFRDQHIAAAVAGVLSLRRVETSRPISSYRICLYINEAHVGMLPTIQQTFPIDQVMHFNMRP